MVFDRKAYRKKWYQDNPDYDKKYYKKNKRKKQLYKQKRNLDPIIRKKRIKYDAEYYQEHKEEKHEYKRNRKHKRAKQIRERRSKDINFAIKDTLKAALRRACKNYGNGKQYTSKEYGIDYTAIAKHLGPKPNDGKEYHIDHIRPLCSFDLTKKREVKRAFAPENHQWLEAMENIKKGGKWIINNIHL